MNIEQLEHALLIHISPSNEVHIARTIKRHLESCRWIYNRTLEEIAPDLTRFHEYDPYQVPGVQLPVCAQYAIVIPNKLLDCTSKIREDIHAALDRVNLGYLVEINSNILHQE